MIYQSKHFSPHNAIKYILKHLLHTFQLLIYHTSRFNHQNPHCSKYITTFQKTIRLIAEHSLIWHFVIYQSKHFSPPNAIKYILKHLQHTFQLLIYHTLVLYPSKSSLFQIHHYISENYQTSRRTQFNLTLCNLPIKTLLTSQRNQIYSEASSTHFSANNLSYLTLYSSKCSLLQIHHYISENYQTSRRTQFKLTICYLSINSLLSSKRN